ncbi:MAG: hypothetical protein Q9205_007177, partial [Flavoplaca limonia]
KNLYPENAPNDVTPIAAMSTSFCSPDGGRTNTKTIDGWIDGNAHVDQVNRFMPITTIPTDEPSPNTGLGGDAVETVIPETVFDSLISAAATETALVSAIDSSVSVSAIQSSSGVTRQSSSTSPQETLAASTTSSPTTGSGGSPNTFVSSTSTSVMAVDAISSTTGAFAPDASSDDSRSGSGSTSTCSVVTSQMECVRRNVGDLCTKDERRPRAKRPKTNGDDIRLPSANKPLKEDDAAEDIMQVLGLLMDEPTYTDSYSSTKATSTSSNVLPDYPNSFWSTTSNSHMQTLKIDLIREIIDTLPELEMIRLLNNVFVIRCQASLGNVFHTPTFLEQAEKFQNCLDFPSSDESVMALNHEIPMDTLACHLLALMLGLAFHPSPSLHEWVSTTWTRRVEELRATDSLFRTLRSLAVRCLQAKVSFFCGSIAGLQAAIMLLLDRHEESHVIDAILATAISGAQKLGLHRLGDAKIACVESDFSSATSPPPSTNPALVRTEVGIRIWWALVMRDWSRGLSLDYYSIHPAHFNTRLPLHINDEDLCPSSAGANGLGFINERPRSEFTQTSYTIYALEIATLARGCIDSFISLRSTKKEVNTSAAMRTNLNRKYEEFLAQLPSHFRLGSSAGLNSTTPPTAAIPVHRWMLHQQIWSLFLRLHQAGLSSEEGRTGCHLLAQNIITTQSQIQARCTICGTLSTNKDQMFKAAVLLLADLLSASNVPSIDRPGAQLNRVMTRSKIEEAMELLKTGDNLTEGEQRSQEHQSDPWETPAENKLRILEALMNLEEEIVTSTPSSGLEQPIAQKIKYVLQRLQIINHENANGARNPSQIPLSSSEPPATASLTHPNELQDYGVLPVLSSGDADDDIWQFLNFDFPASPQNHDGGDFQL